MKRACALLLLVVTTVNCAARGPSFARAAVIEPPPPQAGSAPVVWRRYAQKIPVGSILRVRTESGERLTGTLLVAGDESLIVSPRTRVPEPTREIRFEAIRRLEVVTDEGRNLARAAAVGAGVGAGVFLGLLFVLSAAWAD